jgi:hypothetical protein
MCVFITAGPITKPITKARVFAGNPRDFCVCHGFFLFFKRIKNSEFVLEQLPDLCQLDAGTWSARYCRVLCGSLRRPCFCLPRGYACARLSKQAPPGGAEGIGEMSEHVVAPGPTREDGEDCRSETPSTSNTAQAATSAVAAAPSKLDQDISGLAVVADIQPAGHRDGPSIFGIVAPAHSAGQDSKNEGFFPLHPTADVRAGGNASVLSPADVQRNKLLALHGKGKRDSQMNLLKRDSQLNLLQDSDRAAQSVPTSYGAAGRKSSVKNGPNKRQGGTLSVEIRESTNETLQDGTLSNKPSNTAGARRARSERARASVEEIMKDVPLGTVLSINKLVIKAQARFRGVISRQVMTRYMKRHTGGLRGTDLTTSSNSLPDEDEIVTFCHHTQVSAKSCRLASLAFVDGKVRMSDTVAGTGSRKESEFRHDRNFTPSKVVPLPSANTSRPARQEEEDQEGPGFGAQGLGVGAGYFQFNAIGIEFGSGCVSRYLCLDMGPPDVKKAEDASLQVSALSCIHIDYA